MDSDCFTLFYQVHCKCHSGLREHAQSLMRKCQGVLFRRMGGNTGGNLPIRNVRHLFLSSQILRLQLFMSN